MTDNEKLIALMVLGGTIAYLFYRQSVTYYTGVTMPSDTPQTPVGIGSNYQPASVYTTSASGVDTIRQFEGYRNAAYNDGFGNITIGIGHLIVPGDGMDANTVLTDDEVENLFANDLATAENAVKSYVTAPITQGMFDALVDFVFEFGSTKFASSTLLRLLNLRNYEAARAELSKWVHAGNPPVVVAQIVDRRNADTAMFA